MCWRVLLLVFATCAGTAWTDPPADPIESLTSKDPMVTAVAVRALQVRFAERSLRPAELVRIALLPSLSAEPEAVRQRAERAARDLGHALKPLVGVLLAEAIGEDPHRRDVAAKILAENLDEDTRRKRSELVDGRLVYKPLLAPEHLDAMKRLLRSPHIEPYVKLRLTESMSELGPGVFELVPLLSMLMDDLTAAFRARQAAQAARGVLTTAHAPSPECAWGIGLSELGSAGMPGFIEALKNDDRRIVQVAECGLEWLGDKALPGLLPVLRHPDPEMRKRVLECLDHVKTMTPALLAALKAAEKDADPRVRDAARATLSAIPGAHGEAQLEAAIRSDDPAARHDALYELGWGSNDRDLTKLPDSLQDAIVEVIRHDPLPNWNSLRQLVPALGLRAAPVTKQVFRGIASRKNVGFNTPGDFARALGDEAIPHLVGVLLGSDDARLQDIVTRGLVFAWETLPEVQRKRLATYLDTDSRSERAVLVATALAHPGDTRTELILVPALARRKDWNHRSFAALGLGRLGKQALRYVDALVAALIEIDADLDRIRWWPNRWGHVLRIERGITLLLAHEIERAVPLLGHRCRHVREAAYEALKVQDYATVLGLLGNAWEDQAQVFQIEVLKHWRLSPFLERGLRSPLPAVQLVAARAVFDEDPFLVEALRAKQAHAKLLDSLYAEAVDVCLMMLLDPESQEDPAGLLRGAVRPFDLFPDADDVKGQRRARLLKRLREHTEQESPVVRERVRELIEQIEDDRPK